MTALPGYLESKNEFKEGYYEEIFKGEGFNIDSIKPNIYGDFNYTATRLDSENPTYEVVRESPFRIKITCSRRNGLAPVEKYEAWLNTSQQLQQFINFVDTINFVYLPSNIITNK